VSPSDPSGIYGDGGPATSAILSYGIEGIAVDAAGNLYIADNNADNGHGSLREVSNGIITTFARGSMVWIAPGPGSTFYYTDAFLSVCQIGAGGAAVDIAGSGNGASPGTGAVAALSAYLYYTQGIRVGSAGRIYFADSAGVYVLTPVSGNPGPTLAANNVWNAAGFGGAALAPGSLATVSGGFSLPTASQAAGLPLPTALSGLSFQFETGAGIAAPLFYASVGQAILQIPWETAGLSTVPLSASLNGNTGPAAVIPIAPFGPGIFTMNGTSTGQGAILNSWYQLADSSSPAAPGEVIEIYCTGLGPVRNAPTSGYPASLTALSPTVTTPSVTIGGIPAAVWFSGLAPGSVGEYQVDAQVPAGAPSGPAVPVVISIGGVTSNIVTIAVQ
jgi:uncharacterized protein (TIGR03437 family)